MITMSGSNLRAISSDSATVPASATTWNASRRSRSATRPWRTTSWSSTTRSRSGPGHGLLPSRGLASGTQASFRTAGSGVPPSGHSDDDTRARRRARCRSRGRRRGRRRAVAHVGQALVARARAASGESKPRPLSAISRTAARPIRVDRAVRMTIRARVAFAWRAMLLRASRAIWRSCDRVVSGVEVGQAVLASPSSSTSTIVLSRNSSARPASPPSSPTSSRSSGRSPKMKLRMSRIVRLRPLDRPIDPGPRLVRVVVHELGHVLEREADGVDRPG